MTPNLTLDPASTLLILSPHLDDAVLSCGALIADSVKRGVRVVVLTVFNGSPTLPVSVAADRFHARCGLRAATAMADREREDDLALELLGATAVRLEFPEALYRRGADGRAVYPADQSIFAERSAADLELPAITDKIRLQLDAVGPDLVLAPLGIGAHVDHRLVAEAAQRLDRPVLHYEDVPYLLYDRCAQWQADFALRGCVAHACSAAGWAGKLAAVECYRSQATVLWYRPDSWQAELTGYAQVAGGGQLVERYWQFDE